MTHHNDRPSTVGVDAVEHTLLVSGALSVVQGETDAISDSAWNFGLFKETMVGIFSAEGSLLRVVFNVDQPAFELDINHGSVSVVARCSVPVMFVDDVDAAVARARTSPPISLSASVSLSLHSLYSSRACSSFNQQPS